MNWIRYKNEKLKTGKYLICYHDSDSDGCFIEEAYYLNKGDVVNDEYTEIVKRKMYADTGHSLTAVFYKGLSEDWGKVTIESCGWYLMEDNPQHFSKKAWYQKGIDYYMPYPDAPAEFENVIDPFIECIAKKEENDYEN